MAKKKYRKSRISTPVRVHNDFKKILERLRDEKKQPITNTTWKLARQMRKQLEGTDREYRGIV
jgi:hypothetical protein